MIELIATASGGDGLLVMVDVWRDGPSSLARTMEVLRILSRLTVSAISHIKPGDEERLEAWLKENAGTTELTEGDKLFFAEQLRLAQQECDSLEKRTRR